MSKQALDNITSSVGGNSELLMKKKILNLGKHYIVMDQNQATLCNVILDWGQNIGGQMLSSVAGKWAGRMMSYTYRVTDANGQEALEIRKGKGSFKTHFDIVEPETGENIGGIGLKRGLLFGGMKAQWVDPKTGQGLISVRGNIMRRKYVMLDPSGNEIAKVRHKIMAIRDVWKLELTSGTNHLHAMIFATVLDFEKEM